MRDLKSALAGVSSKVRSRGPITLRDLPLVAEMEAMLTTPGITWTPAFESKRDATSLALFGITDADTRPIEPHPDDYHDARALAADLKARAKYDAALAAWGDWQIKMGRLDAGIRQLGVATAFARLGYDVTDEDGAVLNCFQYFARQLYVAHMGLLPAAKVTLNGSGKRAAPTAEEWGAALAAEAARFRPSR